MRECPAGLCPEWAAEDLLLISPVWNRAWCSRFPPPAPREARTQDFNTETPGLQMYNPNPTQLHSSPNLGLPTCQFFSNNDSKHRGLL